MDEPFGALDAMRREDLQALVLELHAEQGLTTLIVTHNIEEAVTVGHRILVLGQPPQRRALVVDNPAAGQPEYRTTPEFLTRCNHLRALLREATDALA